MDGNRIRRCEYQISSAVMVSIVGAKKKWTHSFLLVGMVIRSRGRHGGATHDECACGCKVPLIGEVLPIEHF